MLGVRLATLAPVGRALPWCSRVGNFDHLVWECARSPLVVDRPPKPASGLLWRLGWVSCKDELYCLDYIARGFRLLWDMRHGQGNNWFSRLVTAFTSWGLWGSGSFGFPGLFVLVRLRVPLRCPVYVCCPLGGRARFSNYYYYYHHWYPTVGYVDTYMADPTPNVFLRIQLNWM